MIDDLNKSVSELYTDGECISIEYNIEISKYNDDRDIDYSDRKELILKDKGIKK